MNINSLHNYPSLSSNQRGAVLIVVLLFLVLIMLVGVIAVQNSSTDLKLATSDQINTILLQSSDSVNNKIEMTVNGSPTSDEHIKIMGFTGIFGHYILNDGSNDDVIDFCYRPRAAFFNIDNSVIRRGTGKLLTNNEGYCSPDNAADYTSARNTTMTQVMIKNVSNGANSPAFSHMSLGSDSSAKTSKKYAFEMFSTSVLPAYGSADTGKIYNCFEKDASKISGGVAECMSDNNIPNKMVIEQVDVVNTKSSEYCTYFGKSNSTGSSNPLCNDI